MSESEGDIPFGEKVRRALEAGEPMPPFPSDMYPDMQGETGELASFAIHTNEMYKSLVAHFHPDQALYFTAAIATGNPGPAPNVPEN